MSNYLDNITSIIIAHVQDGGSESEMRMKVKVELASAIQDGVYDSSIREEAEQLMAITGADV